MPEEMQFRSHKINPPNYFGLIYALELPYKTDNGPRIFGQLMKPSGFRFNCMYFFPIYLQKKWPNIVTTLECGSTPVPLVNHLQNTDPRYQTASVHYDWDKENLLLCVLRSAFLGLRWRSYSLCGTQKQSRRRTRRTLWKLSSRTKRNAGRR